MPNNFDSVAATYERLVDKEDELILKARTCETIIELVIRDLLIHGHEYHFLVMESLLNAMQEVQEEVIIELTLTRIQKGLGAYQMKQAQQLHRQE